MFAARLVCSWIGAFGLATGVFCQTYVTFSVGINLSVSSINEKGEIAGYYQDASHLMHGFVRRLGGEIVSFDVPGSSETFAQSINDEGTITGYYIAAPSSAAHGYVRDPEGNFTLFDHAPNSINAGGAVTGSYAENGVSHGFVRRADGKLISFDPPGSISTTARSINAKGAITGSYQDASHLLHGFVRRLGGEIISFDAPGGSTYATSINDAGVIAGSNGHKGFVRDPHGNFTSFDVPNATTVSPLNMSINDEGAIIFSVGLNIGAASVPFLRSPDGTITFLNIPGCTKTIVMDINDEGVITGSCLSASAPFPFVGWVRFP
jgi:hypothetical protein